MLLVSLEGLPHAGRSCILRNLTSRCPGWTALNVLPDPSAACCWASASTHMGHALFAALLRKVSAITKCGKLPGDAVVLLNSPWYEHLPRHGTVWSLLADVTRALVSALGCGDTVHRHAMIMLHVPHDETFEQMVCCGNPYWNGTSLADLDAMHATVAGHLHGLSADPGGHPFTCATFAIQCPAFFDENEVVASAITDRIIDIVSTLKREACA